MESNNSSDYAFLLTWTVYSVYAYSESKGLSHIDALDNITPTEQSLDPRGKKILKIAIQIAALQEHPGFWVKIQNRQGSRVKKKIMIIGLFLLLTTVLLH